MIQENIIITRETNMELLGDILAFIEKMKIHMEKYPYYRYSIETLGGTPGNYKAKVTILRYNEETEFTKGNTGTYGAL